METDAEIAFLWRREADERYASERARDSYISKIHDDMANRYADKAWELEAKKREEARASRKILIFRPVAR